jgi:uncharacterized protein YfiM (DUF2279 family)
MKELARSAASDPMFGIDKAVHVIVSAGIASLVYAGASRVLPHWPALAVAAGSTMAVGLDKERWDANHRSRWSWKDLAADAAGVLLTVAVTTAIRSWGRRSPYRQR